MKVQMLKTLYICIFFALPLFPRAQTVSGSWFGRADVEMAGMHNNYLTELVIKQKGTRVDGIFGYYFRDKYQSFFVHGRYNPKTREITILNIPVIYYASNSTVNNIDCNTNFRGTLIISKVSSSLTGTFYHDERYKYLCPDLKVSYTLDRGDHEQDSALTAVAARARMWKPQPDDVVVNEVKAAPLPVSTARADSSAPTDSGRTASVDSAKATVADRVDTAKTVSVAAATAVPVTPPVVTIADSGKIAASFVKRKAVLNQELLVESDSIRLSF